MAIWRPGSQQGQHLWLTCDSPLVWRGSSGHRGGREGRGLALGEGQAHWRQVSWKASRVRKSLHVGGRPSCRNFPQRWQGAWKSFM